MAVVRDTAESVADISFLSATPPYSHTRVCQSGIVEGGSDMVNVGGDPAQMTGGARILHRSGASLRSMEAGVSRAVHGAENAVGDPVLSGALSRFGAGLANFVSDTGTQVEAAAQLASNAAQDLDTVGGAH